MGTFYRQTNLVLRGNKGLVPAGQQVISQVDGQKYNFEAGRPIVYDPITGLTLDAAGIATAKSVRIGVGHNPNRGRLATEIRHLGGDDIDLCESSIAIKVTQPVCPTPFVIDFEGGCFFTGRDYMFQLEIDDAMTRSMFKEGTYDHLLINLRDELTACTNCTEEESCDKLMFQLAAKINNQWIKYFPNTTKLGTNQDVGRPYAGVWAAKKYTNTVTKTLAASAVEDVCDTGCAVKGLKSVSATGMTTLVLVNAVDPSAPTQTLAEQIPGVIAQINAWMDGKGSVYPKLVDCCSWEWEFNSCLANIVLTYHDDSAASSASLAAFSEFAIDDPAIQCDTPAVDTNACGVRIFVDPLELPCNCLYPDVNPPSYFGRTAKITAWGDGWENTSWRAPIVSKGSVPIGTGYDVQQQELKNSNGGEGFDYAYGVSMNDGRYPLPLGSSAFAQASVAECEAMYCIWSVVIKNSIAPSPHARNVQNSQSVGWINIKRTDTVDIAVMEDVFTALAERGFCSSAVIECIPASS